MEIQPRLISHTHFREIIRRATKSKAYDGIPPDRLILEAHDKALRQQLTDKERELQRVITTDQLMATLFAYNDALDKLTAANAVVDHLEKFHYCEIINMAKSSDEACTVCATIERHKLQGGDGDE